MWYPLPPSYQPDESRVCWIGSVVGRVSKHGLVSGHGVLWRPLLAVLSAGNDFPCVDARIRREYRRQAVSELSLLCRLLSQYARIFAGRFRRFGLFAAPRRSLRFARRRERLRRQGGGRIGQFRRRTPVLAVSASERARAVPSMAARPAYRNTLRVAAAPLEVVPTGCGVPAAVPSDTAADLAIHRAGAVLAALPAGGADNFRR